MSSSKLFLRFKNEYESGADQPDVEYLIMICSAINFIHASALETVDSLVGALKNMRVTLYLAEMKGPVMDQLKKVGFEQRLGD
ncbi:MAG: sodium-independent anion transporter [Cyanobacteria bacterium P01_A01_bin.37]